MYKTRGKHVRSPYSNNCHLFSGRGLGLLLLECKILLVELVHSINHGLHQLHLRVSQSMFVGDIVSVSSLATRLSSGSSGLKSQFLAPGLQLVNSLLGPSGEVDVDRSPHSGSQVGRARMDVSVFLIKTEVLSRFLLDRVSDSCDSPSEPLEDSENIATLFHGDDPELILLVHPHKESLLFVVEDTSTLGPISLHSSDSQISVSRHEEEMIINKLLSDLLFHTGQRVVLSGEILGELLAGRGEQFLNSKPLQLRAPGRQLVNSRLGPSGEVDVDRSPHSGSQVGGARMDVSVFLIKTEVLSRFLLDRVSDSCDSPSEPLEDSENIATLFHGDDPELILLVHPHKESLLFVVEDTSTLGPISLHSSDSQISVSRHEKEMIINKLLSDLLFHTGQRVVLSGEILGELLAGREQFLNSKPLFLGDSGRKTKSIDRSTDPNPGGVDRGIRVHVSGDLAEVHVGGVLGIGTDSMVLLDDGIKDISEVPVGVPVTSVDSAVLVVKLNSTGNGLGQSESRGGSRVLVELVPFLLGYVLSNQGVGGFDCWEVRDSTIGTLRWRLKLDK
eukprot:sb/3463539/